MSKQDIINHITSKKERAMTNSENEEIVTFNAKYVEGIAVEIEQQILDENKKNKYRQLIDDFLRRKEAIIEKDKHIREKKAAKGAHFASEKKF